MRADAPPPGKREFMPPMTAEHLDHFVHPGGIPTFEAPFLPPAEHQGTDPHTYAANGYLCHRTPAYIPNVAENPAAWQRVQTLPWSDFDTYDIEGHKDRWQPLERARPLLFKFPARPIWERTIARFNLRNGPIIRVGNSTLTLLPLIQLVARLPRAEIFIPSEIHAHLLIRHRYGQAIITPINKMLPDYNPEDCRFQILTNRKSHTPAMKGGLM